MQNLRLAQRYAKSLIDLAVELNQLDIIYNDVVLLNAIASKSKEFVQMLKSPVINPDKKYKIIEKVSGNTLCKTTQTFIKLLCSKNREAALRDILISFIDQYNAIKDIHKVVLTTASPVSDDIKSSFIKRLQTSSAQNIQLEAKVDEDIIGGFILEMDGKLIDASVLRDLNDVRKQFANNDYIHKLR